MSTPDTVPHGGRNQWPELKPKQKERIMKTTWLERMDRIGVQVDRSGVGHCWQRVWADDLPADVAEEIAAEIADGQHNCDDYVAGNGMHYRWGT